MTDCGGTVINLFGMNQYAGYAGFLERISVFETGVGFIAALDAIPELSYLDRGVIKYMKSSQRAVDERDLMNSFQIGHKVLGNCLTCLIRSEYLAFDRDAVPWINTCKIAYSGSPGLIGYGEFDDKTKMNNDFTRYRFESQRSWQMFCAEIGFFGS